MEERHRDVVAVLGREPSPSMLPTPKRTQWACGMTTPFDGPVVPEVYMTQAVSAARGNGPPIPGPTAIR